MKKFLVAGLIGLLGFAGSSFLVRPLVIDKISASIVSKQVQSGKSVTIKGEVFYQNNGNMVTNFTYPRAYIVISNKVGEIKIYDPANNTVLQYQNALFSSQTSQFYYFFSGKIADMGLTDIGFVQEKTYPEKGALVSLWKLKVPDRKAVIQKVKLVYQGQKPVYMHYEDAGGKIIRKIYYYNYTPVENSQFPFTTTEIVYGEGDSTVTKTQFSDFKINQDATSQYFNFKIPSNAKIEKQ
ncbi:MAG: hypothetical protein INR73_24840 [Williamsia sp.]|nr:hypothetical protein [Williamsia sp.]